LAAWAAGVPVIAITAKAASGLISSSNDRKHRSADGLQVIIVSYLSGLVGAGDIAGRWLGAGDNPDICVR